MFVVLREKREKEWIIIKRRAFKHPEDITELTAQYLALLEALKWLDEYTKKDDYFWYEITIYTDSESIDNHFFGLSKVRKKHLQLYNQCFEIYNAMRERELPVSISWIEKQRNFAIRLFKQVPKKNK